MEDRGFDLNGRLETLENAGRKRRLTPVDRVAERGYFAFPSGGELPVLESDEALLFGSNNYLGLTMDQRVQNAARQAAATVGTGAGASRLETGDTMVHRDLERLLTETTGTDRTIAFPSGYAANVGTITALEPDAIFVDERTHASVVDGCRLSGAAVVEYHHCDVESLHSKLTARSERLETETESWLVVTESVFGLDGSVAPLADICATAEAFGAWVMVDEAHAIGLYANGGGVVQAENLEDRVHVQMGTLSTALASQGGYVAGTDDLVECLINHARPFVHSTGLSPPAAAAASEALHVSRHGDCRERLWENVVHLRDGLETMGYDVESASHILSIRVSEQRVARDLAEGLREQNVVVSAVYPLVAPEGTNLIRIVPMATHDRTDVVVCLEALQRAGEEAAIL